MSTVKVVLIEPGSKVAETRTVATELAAFQALVGGSLEGLRMPGTVSVYINEDGKALGLARNEYGDLFVKHQLSLTGRTLLPGDYIAGPVVLVGLPDSDGWDTDVPEDVLAELRALGMEVRDA